MSALSNLSGRNTIDYRVVRSMICDKVLSKVGKYEHLDRLVFAGDYMLMLQLGKVEHISSFEIWTSNPEDENKVSKILMDTSRYIESLAGISYVKTDEDFLGDTYLFSMMVHFNGSLNDLVIKVMRSTDTRGSEYQSVNILRHQVPTMPIEWYGYKHIYNIGNNFDPNVFDFINMYLISQKIPVSNCSEIMRFFDIFDTTVYLDGINDSDAYALRFENDFKGSCFIEDGAYDCVEVYNTVKKYINACMNTNHSRIRGTKVPYEDLTF